VLNGQIDFASREGVGTTFEIRFPLVLAETD
jgi:chemotaxis protein histidine kinase CheA